MNSERIKDLINKGFITQVETLGNLEKMSEVELIVNGYITQTGIFDGIEETIDEVIPVEDDDTVNEETGDVKDNEDEPIDEPIDEPTEVEPDDAPLVEDETIVKDVTSDPVEEEDIP